MFYRHHILYIEEPVTKSNLVDSQKNEMKYVELKENISSTNDKNVTELSSKVFIAQLTYLKKQARTFMKSYFYEKKYLALLEDKGSDKAWSKVQYFLTVPGMCSLYHRKITNVFINIPSNMV